MTDQSRRLAESAAFVKPAMSAFTVTLMLLVGGCAGNDGPMTRPDFTETQSMFRANTSFKNRVVEVEAPRPDGSVRRLNSINHLEAQWGIYLPPPAIPGFVSREWLLSENRHDGRTLLYAAVVWDDDDPTDYLAGGWWLHYPPGASFGDFESAELSGFTDGPELDPSNPPDLPVSGTATFAGGMGGIYEYRYGSGWGDLQGDSQFIEFTAPANFTADFSEATVAGCIGCAGDIETQALHLFPIVTWRTPDPDALPTDYEMRFAPTSYKSDGTFENTDIAVSHSERDVTLTEGLWAGQFSNIPDADGNPRLVVGFSDVDFHEADGSTGNFVGIFTAYTPNTLNP